MEDLTLVFRLINGVFTIGLFGILYPMYLKNRRRFYLIWSIGFLTYGISICIRAIGPAISMNYLLETALAGILLMFGFSAIFAGLGDLVDKLKMYLIGSLIVPFSIIIIYLVSAPTTIGWMLGVAPYLLISGTLFFMRSKYKVDVDLLASGWIFLLVINFGIPFNLISAEYGEILAIIGKLVILAGILIPRFSLLAEDLKLFLLSGHAESYETGEGGGITLIKSSLTREEEIKWITNKINEKKGGIQRTILITTHDLISPQEIRREQVNDQDLYIVRMIHGSQEVSNLFQEKVMTINDDMTEFGLLLSEIIGFSRERKIKVNIILYNLSALLELHDWKKIYEQLLTMIPRLKAAGVQINAFFYPETHADKIVVEVFTNMADEVTSLKSIY